MSAEHEWCQVVAGTAIPVPEQQKSGSQCANATGQGCTKSVTKDHAMSHQADCTVSIAPLDSPTPLPKLWPAEYFMGNERLKQVVARKDGHDRLVWYLPELILLLNTAGVLFPLPIKTL